MLRVCTLGEVWDATSSTSSLLGMSVSAPPQHLSSQAYLYYSACNATGSAPSALVGKQQESTGPQGPWLAVGGLYCPSCLGGGNEVGSSQSDCVQETSEDQTCYARACGAVPHGWVPCTLWIQADLAATGQPWPLGTCTL